MLRVASGTSYGVMSTPATVSDMASSGFWVHMPISGGIFRCRGSYIQGWHTSIHSIPRPFYPSELTRIMLASTPICRRSMSAKYIFSVISTART